MSERMNKERAKNFLKDFNEQIKDYGEDMMPEEKELSQALDIAIESLQDEVEELEKMESKALEDYSEEKIKEAVSKFSKTIKQINNRIQGKDNEWIDIRDRFPSESENVLITCFYCYSGEYDVTLGHCENGEWYYTDERVLISNADSTEENSAQIVIAWKPLPKPYERKE